MQRSDINARTRSSRSHSRNVSLRSPHSMFKTSDRVAASDGVSWTPEKSTVRGLVPDALYSSGVSGR
jgi:hypothetical protein